MVFERENLTPLERDKRDPRSVAELIETALMRNWDIEPQCDPAVHALVVLQARGSREVLEAAKILRRSADSAGRELAADIFGQLGQPERSFPDECCDELVDSDDDPDRHHLLDDGVRKVLGLDEKAQWTTEQALAALRKLVR